MISTQMQNYYYFQSISPGMVDTDLLKIYDSTLIEHLPKLKAADVTTAVFYALSTADYVQVIKLLILEWRMNPRKVTD